MSIKIFQFLIYGLFSFLTFAQNAPTKRKLSSFKKIYSSAISFYYGSKPANIVLTDSTVNRYVAETSYNDIADNLDKRNVIFNGSVKLDASWVSVLRKADKKKNNLKNYKLPDIKLNNWGIRLVSKDSIRLSMQDMGMEGFRKVFQVGDYIELSSIILIKNKAILELSRFNNELNAEGKIFFLKKIKKKWVVVSFINTWVS